MIQAALKSIGFAKYYREGIKLELKSSNPEVLKFLTPLLKRHLGRVVVSYRRKNTLKKDNTYFLEIEVPSAEILSETLERPLVSGCCRRNYFAMIFLLCGTLQLSAPFTIEIFHHDRAVLNRIRKIGREDLGLLLKIYTLRKLYLLVGKGKSVAEKFLDGFSLNRSILFLEDRNIMMEIKNLTNRLVNCETGNLKKIVTSSSKQLYWIEAIKSGIGLENINKRLKDAALLRIWNPCLSLSELAEKSGGKFTKSSLNHCFREIRNIFLEITDLKVS